MHIFGLVADDAASQWMGTIISNYEERKRVLEGVRLIDEIMLQDTFDPVDNLKILHQRYPEAIIMVFHGDNWNIMPVESYLNSIRGKVEFVPYYEKMSPSNIMEKLKVQEKEKHKVKTNLLSTKASTLEALRPLLKKAHIEDLYVLTVKQFRDNPRDTLDSIGQFFRGRTMVVRSSYAGEDGILNSNVGHFDSVLNVDSGSSEDVKSAVEQVIQSYGGIYDQANEQILLQTQTLDVDISGVVFTRDIRGNTPYYLVNYDDKGSTSAVNGGVGFC